MRPRRTELHYIGTFVLLSRVIDILIASLWNVGFLDGILVPSWESRAFVFQSPSETIRDKTLIPRCNC